MTNVFDLMSERFEGAGDFLRSPAGVPLYSYADLFSISGSLAARLAGMGLTPGDRVLVQVEKSPHNLFTYFACLRAGLIYLPLNTAYQRHEIEYFLANAEPALVICDPAAERQFAGMTGGPVLTLAADGAGTLFDGLGHGPADAPFEGVDCADEDVAVILYTSGTTGQPKGAMITHGNLAVNALALHSAWGWQPGDVLLHALPIYHIHGLFVATNLAVMNGSPIVLLPRFEADEVIRLLPDSTVYMGVPTNYVRLLAHPGLTETACRNMRLFTSGSAPLLAQTFDEFRQRTGHTIVERYGMTETGMNTSNPLGGERKAGTVGPPLPGVSLRIVDQAGEDVAPGTPGDLLVRGQNVFRGYWRMPEKTAEEFDDKGYFRTGDIASMDEDGYVSIVGRNKDMIITGGLNVYPKEIESVIDDMQGVIESAIIGVPHHDFGEAVTAVVVREPGAALTEDNVIAHLKASLANFKVAKNVYFVDELPRNAMGKVQKNLLRDRFAAP